MLNGYFSMVLHAHLPYIRHREAQRLEELWLFEAISETYIPLLWNLGDQESLHALTISFSTPLMEMLSDPLMQRRYLHYIERTESLLKKEVNRDQTAKEKDVVEFYLKRTKRIKRTFLKWDQNLLKGFRQHAENGKIICICSSATHAFLPYLQTEAGVRAQIIHGIKVFRDHFGHVPRGFWLPECGFTPGIDRILFEEGIRYTFVDEHALKHADPAPSKAIGAPIYSPHGVMLFGRNSILSSQVWSSTNGYPGDFDYREFYRDIAYERDWEYIKPYMNNKKSRNDTGLKYHRITGLTEVKQFYQRENALDKVKEHSDHFIQLVKAELAKNQGQSFPPYMITLPFDAELFGHWWFEGTDWLKELISSGNEQISITTPEQFIDRHFQDIETSHVSFNTWGKYGYGEVWLNEKNSWIYRHLHRIEKELIQLVTKFRNRDVDTDRCLKQMAREWMLATSSDWSFIITENSATEYANNRINEHISRFDSLKELLVPQNFNHEILIQYEADYPFLKDVFLEIFISHHDDNVSKETKLKQLELNKKTVIMLAWEYPPKVVGGLSRHVYDLANSLNRQGWEIHVITTAIEGHLDYEVINGVQVHRVHCLQPYADDFYQWVGSFNLALCEYVLKLATQISFDMIHAHDWLVCVAAKALKDQLDLPLIATIHATEYGRNGGIYTSLQKAICDKELELTNEASHVIVCSRYMEEEVSNLFQLQKGKITMIPNGVDQKTVLGTSVSWKQMYGKETDLFIFSVGRIVQEKGFQTIIDAAPTILEKHRNVKFIIAGKGPLLDEYRKQVIEKGLQETIHFIGFVDDQLRNEFLNGCDICLFPSYYEPFGIVALEAMIAGKTTIVSDTGGFAEIISHRETGLKIYPRDAQSLITQVLTSIEDKQLAKIIAKNGKELAKTKYSWDLITKETIAVYEASLRDLQENN